jgi:inorganic pyrophosphatase/exopolyphosphatase
MEHTIIVTAYENPDLDGTACACAYSEFLNKNGRHVQTGLFGTPHREAQFVIDMFHIPQPDPAEKFINEKTTYILLDASEIAGIAKTIKPEQVVEIIDHRKVTEIEKFPNAKAQIELVGSCATLIAEKFAESKTEISEHAAVLLYSAIVSNTVNFLANVTTDRDRKMAEWLQTKCTIPSTYTHDMFAAKSHFTKPIKQVLDDDFATFIFAGKHIGIAQLEIVDGGKFVHERKDEIITALSELKREQTLDYIFLTCVDVEKGGNTIVVIDTNTKELLEKALLVSFIGDVAKRQGVMMRKTITPLLKAVLEM